MNYPLFAGTENDINYELFRFQIITVWNCNPSTSTSDYSPTRNVDSVSIFFTMHLWELFSFFSVLAMIMDPSECADVVKLEDEMAEGKGLWRADPQSSVFCCNGNDCHFGFLCGPQFPHTDRCCPDGMKCTTSGIGCVKRNI